MDKVLLRSKFVALVAACVGLAGCSYTHDAWFANPCSEPLVVRTYYADRGTNGSTRSDEKIAEATLAPNAVTKVEDAFQDANGFTWFIEVDGAEPISVSKDDMPNWFVSVPASACGAG